MSSSRQHGAWRTRYVPGRHGQTNGSGGGREATARVYLQEQRASSRGRTRSASPAVARPGGVARPGTAGAGRTGVTKGMDRHVVASYPFKFAGKDFQAGGGGQAGRSGARPASANAGIKSRYAGVGRAASRQEARGRSTQKSTTGTSGWLMAHAKGGHDTRQQLQLQHHARQRQREDDEHARRQQQQRQQHQQMLDERERLANQPMSGQQEERLPGPEPVPGQAGNERTQQQRPKSGMTFAQWRGKAKGPSEGPSTGWASGGGGGGDTGGLRLALESAGQRERSASSAANTGGGGSSGAHTHRGSKPQPPVVQKKLPPRPSTAGPVAPSHRGRRPLEQGAAVPGSSMAERREVQPSASSGYSSHMVDKLNRAVQDAREREEGAGPSDAAASGTDPASLAGALVAEADLHESTIAREKARSRSAVPARPSTAPWKPTGARQRAVLGPESSVSSVDDGLVESEMDLLASVDRSFMTDDVRQALEDPAWDGSGRTTMYAFGKVLGKGSFGTVRLVVNRLCGLRAAVKLYDKRKIKDKAQLKRMQTEVRLMERLNHPGIVRLFETVESWNRVHLIMEYAGGGNLCNYVKLRKRLSEYESRHLFCQLAQAVEYLHNMNITHRDIKLENVLLDSFRNTKLVDFGFSVCSRNKRLNVFCGTPSYMAPEIVMRRQYFGPPVDIWSLGVLLYAMLCGRFPFSASSYPSLYRKIARGRFHLPEFLSHSVRDLLTGMLCLDPIKRVTVAQIKRHPWCSATMNPQRPVRRRSKHLVSENPADDLVPQIVKPLEQLGVSRTAIVNSVLGKKKNFISTVFYLLAAHRELRVHRPQSGGTAGSQRSTIGESVTDSTGIGSSTEHDASNALDHQAAGNTKAGNSGSDEDVSVGLDAPGTAGEAHGSRAETNATNGPSREPSTELTSLASHVHKAKTEVG